MRLFLATFTLAILTVPTASASVVFNINASLQYGGTLTGTITTNNAFSSVTSFDITASAGPGSPGFTFAGFEYDSLDASVVVDTSTLLQFDSTAAGEELRLSFSSPLSAGGAVVTTASYESETSAGSRSVTSGAITPAAVAAPEPASAWLLGFGLSSLLWLGRRIKTCRYRS